MTNNKLIYFRKCFKIGTNVTSQLPKTNRRYSVLPDNYRDGDGRWNGVINIVLSENNQTKNCILLFVKTKLRTAKIYIFFAGKGDRHRPRTTLCALTFERFFFARQYSFLGNGYFMAMVKRKKMFTFQRLRIYTVSSTKYFRVDTV